MKWNVVATFVNITNVGGATTDLRGVMMRTSRLPGLAGGWTAVTASISGSSAEVARGVGVRWRPFRSSRTASACAHRQRGQVQDGGESRNLNRRRTSSSKILAAVSLPLPFIRSRGGDDDDPRESRRARLRRR